MFTCGKNLIPNYQEHVNSMVPGSASGVVSVPGGMNPEIARIKTDLGKCVFSLFKFNTFTKIDFPPLLLITPRGIRVTFYSHGV